MSITREQVADLQPGDVVEYHNWDWPNGVTIRGALYTKGPGGLWLGDQHLRMEDGDVRSGDYWKGTLTVVSRAPRLYVNHSRTEPAVGDIVRDSDGDAWRYWGIGWCVADKASRNPAEVDIRCYGPLTLLWDGDGQVIP